MPPLTQSPRLVKRDVEFSESIVPTQWSFKQWAKQDRKLKDIFEN